MLDENLPTFYLRSNGQKHHSNIFLCQHGNEPEPAYSLRHLDASLPASKNCYAVAVYDPYITDVLFGEVLIHPEWTQPSLSAEAIRQNGGVPPPPEPILPTQFTIHLYNPDQQVTVRYKPKSWNTPPTWEFEMPERTFRQPSNSSLDRTQTDPAASDLTPKLKFIWRKDGTLSRDFACYLSGKTTAPDGRKKSKEPDITISIFKGFKEITLYEPNLYRVEMEDFKGLEVVLMLGAVVIRDVYFGSLKDAFHVSDLPVSIGPGGRKLSSPPAAAAMSPNHKPTTSSANAASSLKPSRPQITIPRRDSRPLPAVPAMDPRTRWEIDAGNTRLKQQQEAEKRERRRRAEEEERQTRKMLEAEKRAACKKQAEIDRETQRLKQVYGSQDQQYRQRQNPATRPNVVVSNTSPTHQARYGHYQQPRPSHHGPYLQAPSGHGRTHSAVSFHQPQVRPQSSLSFFGNPQASASSLVVPQLKEKRSFFGFRKNSDGDNSKLSKKRSSIF